MQYIIKLFFSWSDEIDNGMIAGTEMSVRREGQNDECEKGGKDGGYEDLKG